MGRLLLGLLLLLGAAGVVEVGVPSMAPPAMSVPAAMPAGPPAAVRGILALARLARGRLHPRMSDRYRPLFRPPIARIRFQTRPQFLPEKGPQSDPLSRDPYSDSHDNPWRGFSAFPSRGGVDVDLRPRGLA